MTLSGTITTKVELYIDGAWVDITSDVRGAPNINITTGQGSEGSGLNSGHCELVLNNADGTYSNRNPLSTYFGKIGRNTPLRVRQEGAFTAPSVRAVSSASGFGSSYTVAPPTNVEGDLLVAFQTADVTADVDMTEPTGDWFLVTSVLTGTFSLCTKVWYRVSNGHEPSTYTFSQGGSADTVVSIAAIQDAGTAIPVVATTTEDAPGASFDTPTTTPNGSHDLELRWVAGSDATGVAGVTWTSPATYTEKSDLQGGNFTTGSLASKSLSSNAATGVKTFTCSSAALDWAHGVTVDIVDQSIRFHGEVSTWPQRWDTTGTDVWVPIEANGIVRRLDVGAQRLKSALYRQISLFGDTQAYWPLEDGADSTSIASGISGGTPMRVNGDITFASREIFNGSGNNPVLASDSTVLTGDIISDNTGALEVDGLFFIPTAIPNNTTIFDLVQSEVSTITHFTVAHTTGGNLSLGAYNGSTLVHSASLVTDVRNRDQLIGFYAIQEGADIFYSLFCEYFVGGTLVLDSTSGTWTSDTIGKATQLIVGSGGFLNDVAVGHLAFTNSFYSLEIFLEDALNGFGGETAARRLLRLCKEEGVAINILGDPGSSVEMAPQTKDTLITLLEQCADADQGILYEQTGALGLEYRTRQSLYNQTAGAALNYATFHLSGSLEPLDDDSAIWNDVNVKTPGGSSYRAVQETGPLSVQAPPDGVGTYDRGELTAYLTQDDDLADFAGWTRHLGTWDEARYPTIQVDFARGVWLADTTLTRQAALLKPGDILTVSNPPLWVAPDTITALVRGYTEVINKFEWTITWNASPGNPYTVNALDSSTYAHLGSEDFVVAEAVNSSATTLKIATSTPPLFTEAAGNYPIPLRVGGERMTATAMTHTAITFIAVGVVAHANNASVTPGAPAGRAVGDLLLLFAAIRNSGTGTVNAPTGYTQMLANGNFALYGRIATNTAADLPTVSFTGGVANADTSAQIACFRGDFYDINEVCVSQLTALNGSAQDIIFPGIYVPRDNCLIVIGGWKQDDWTSVATVSGFTEIGEPATTTGDDQGLVWDYKIQTTKAVVSGGSFVVTGGAAAISRSFIAVIGYDVQRATVTRSVNGVVKAQVVGEDVSLWTPERLAR